MRGEFVELDLAELADVADALAAKGGEVGRDARGGEVDDASERLVEEGADAGDGEAASGGGEGVNHGFEAEIDFSGADDFGDVLEWLLSMI